jgi:hypothetical protein
MLTTFQRFSLNLITNKSARKEYGVRENEIVLLHTTTMNTSRPNFYSATLLHNKSLLSDTLSVSKVSPN